MDNKEHIEKVMSRMLEDLADSYQPDFDRILRDASLEIEKREKVKKRRRRSGIAAASVFVILFAVSCIALTFDAGYAGHFRQFFTRESGQEGEQTADNFIDGENGSEFEYETITREELEEIPLFNGADPTYLPEGYTLGEIQTVSVFDETWKIQIRYNNADSIKRIVYEIIASEYKTARADLIDYEEGEVKTVEEKGILYTYSCNANDMSNIVYWEKNEIFYEVKGDETPEELLQVALSVKL